MNLISRFVIHAPECIIYLHSYVFFLRSSLIIISGLFASPMPAPRLHTVPGICTCVFHLEMPRCLYCSYREVELRAQHLLLPLCHCNRLGRGHCEEDICCIQSTTQILVAPKDSFRDNVADKDSAPEFSIPTQITKISISCNYLQ